MVMNGVDLTRYGPRPRDQALADAWGLAGKFVVGYVGTHGMAHALCNVLDAAERLRDTRVLPLPWAPAPSVRRSPPRPYVADCETQCSRGLRRRLPQDVAAAPGPLRPRAGRTCATTDTIDQMGAIVEGMGRKRLTLRPAHRGQGALVQSARGPPSGAAAGWAQTG